jgi:hypothetical protein
MKIEEIKRQKDRQPFEPFKIQLANGKEALVSHPDAVSWDLEAPRIIYCILPGGRWAVIDVALIIALDTAAPVSSI